MPVALVVHLLALGAWLGCVSVEAVIELGARRAGPIRNVAAALHRRIDLFVEIPTFTAVLASGMWMLEPARLGDASYFAKIWLGCAAVLVNALCVVPVLRRARDAPAAFDRHARWIWIAFATGVPAGLGALALGLRLGGLL